MRPSVLLPLLLLAGAAFAAPAQERDAADGGGIRPDPAMEALRHVRGEMDSALAEERNLYWLKCRGAMRARTEGRKLALRGAALFLADAPLEFAASQYRHKRKREPAALNGVAFALWGLSLLHFAMAYRHEEEYRRDRACCRIWMDYAKEVSP